MTGTLLPLAAYFDRRGVRQIQVAHGITTPELFTDPHAEHMATRRAAGLFDFSFMACVEIDGGDTLALLHRLQTRNLTRLAERRLAYSLLLRDNGTVINDATIWRTAENRYLIFTGRCDDLQHIAQLASGLRVGIADRSRNQAVIAVQGAQAWTTISRCFARHGSGILARPPYYGFSMLTFNDSACLLARVSYSGESGYEIVITAEAAPDLWHALLGAGEEYGLAECGFRAIDSLRIEAGHILYLRELALAVTPFEIGLARLVDFYNPDCPGITSLRPQRWQSPERALAGLVLDGYVSASGFNDPSAFYAVNNGRALLTSICLSPVFGRHIGIGFVDAAHRHPGTRVRLQSGAVATVARLPFYDPARYLARRNG